MITIKQAELNCHNAWLKCCAAREAYLRALRKGHSTIIKVLTIKAYEKWRDEYSYWFRTVTELV